MMIRMMMTTKAPPTPPPIAATADLPTAPGMEVTVTSSVIKVESY